jgi:type IV secretory pathway TrbD component
LNLRIFVTRHWKAIVIALQIGLVVLSLAAAMAHAEPIDSPVGPRAC